MKYVLSLLFLTVGLLVLHGQTKNAGENTLFTLIKSSHSGIDFNNKIKDLSASNILLYDNYYGGAGVATADFDNDGLTDIFFAGNLAADKLYHNQGDLKFKDVSKKSGILDDGGWTTGVTVADVNNDGFLDVYLSRELYDDPSALRRNLLYINNGDLTFTESAERYGVADTQRTRHASFFDYNKDGFLDLFLLTQPPNPGSYSPYAGTNLLQPQYHLRLLQNTGKETFTDVSRQAGIDLSGFPNAVSTCDFNNDGWADIYVANDFEVPDFFFINNQDGTFTNVADDALNHISFYSMGVDAADINNNGQLDIFVVDMAAEDNFRSKANMSGMNPELFWQVVNEGGHYQYMYNSFQLSNGNGTYSDLSQMFGMANTDWSWANLIADFNNDGLKDVYVTNGLLRDIRNTDADKEVARAINTTLLSYIQQHPNSTDPISALDLIDLDKVLGVLPSQPLKNYAYQNLGNLTFEKIMDDWGLDQESFSNGAAYADLDNDGDLDLVVNNINAEAFLYQNNSENKPGSNHVRIRLASKQHLPVLGSRLLLYHGGEVQMIELTSVRGIYSASEPAAHFGLGNTQKIDSLVVYWPDAGKTVLEGIESNQTIDLYLEDANGAYKKGAYSMNSKYLGNTYFEQQQPKGPLDHRHEENAFNDFDHQVLLPHKLSQFGPALAVGDVNGDGLEDVFIGGATGFSAALYVQKPDGAFSKRNEALWTKDKKYEDVDALFVDINKDGLQDLYVVSGGNEFESNHPNYKDRLYINDGLGGFTAELFSSEVSASGSVVRACDYDMDGDLDLFVGGRLQPQRYPMPASSTFMKNVDGQLIDASSELAPELEGLGMVTDAVWSDYDGDGDFDLVVVGEWMPITLFLNEEGTLQKQATDGLSNSSGWWFSIEKGDFDQDGDDDFVVGNLGLNYKYKTSAAHPFDIYYHDFDRNGRGDIVLGYYHQNKHYPVRGFSCSAQQVPQLKQKIQRYDVFASLEIDQVYGSENLQRSLHYTANTFASSYVENLGNGSFQLHELPRMAQTSSINDLIVDDINGDGHLDVLAVGNLYVSEVETPRNDAGTGVLLLGDGKGQFVTVSSSESGFFNKLDAKKMAKITIGNYHFVCVANNNGPIQLFKKQR